MNIKNIQQSVNGIKEIKLLNLEYYFFNIFKINISKICKYETKQRYFASAPRLLIELSAISLFAGSILFFSLCALIYKAIHLFCCFKNFIKSWKSWHIYFSNDLTSLLVTSSSQFPSLEFRMEVFLH